MTHIAQYGSTTMVLPDHFYCGYYDYFQDRFPLGTHFILASDGFYSAFSDSKDLWNWLQDNKQLLADKTKSREILEQLHSTLSVKTSDDDISFVWAYPHDTEFKKAENKITKKKGTKPCQRKS